MNVPGDLVIGEALTNKLDDAGRIQDDAVSGDQVRHRLLRDWSFVRPSGVLNVIERATTSLRGALSDEAIQTSLPQDGLLRFARNDGWRGRQCLVPKICRASAGLAISRPARRAQPAISSISCPFEVTLVPLAR